jgi:hypothetical protein
MDTTAGLTRRGPYLGRTAQEERGHPAEPSCAFACPPPFFGDSSLISKLSSLTDHGFAFSDGIDAAARKMAPSIFEAAP